MSKFVGGADVVGNACKDFSVVDFKGYFDTQFLEHGIDHLYQFQLVEQGGAANHVGIALVEFAVAAFLRAVGTPHGLQLIAAEGEGELVAVLDNKTSKGYGEVVAQTTVAYSGGYLVIVL